MQVSQVTFTTQGALRKSALRAANERLVLNAIRQNPQLSRVEVSKITGLSPSSITFIVKRLVKEKLVREDKTDVATLGVGRPPTILRLSSSARYVVGVEISPNGSRVRLADWNGATLETIAVDWQSDPEQHLRALHGAIRGFVTSKSGRRILGVGVSVPGTWDAEARTVTTAVNLGWRDVPVAPLLQKGFDVPMFFDNNANLSALGERWFRSASSKQLENFVFVTLGDGIGTGIIVSGQVLHGAFGRAGEFGHMTVFPDGRTCLCKNKGCWEEYASDRALIRQYLELTGERLTSYRVVERARQADAHALRAVQEAARHLALGFASLIVGLNPEAIVIDNWAAAGWDLIEDLVSEELRHRVRAAWLEGIHIEPSTHAHDSSLLGAIALVLTRYFHSFDHGKVEDTRNLVSMQG